MKKKEKLTNSKSGGGGIYNKINAFTLIELLAIIVILAIIAVITVPIILNVIENAKKGAAVDSAYGYKDAIEKYYLTEMLDNPDLKLDGDYEVKENGQGQLIDESGEEYSIQMSGTIPSGGYISIENNEITKGCLVIDEYKIELQDGEFTTTGKGECSSLALMICKSKDIVRSPEEWFDFDKDTKTIKALTDQYDDMIKDIAIPCSIDGVEVINIGNRAFEQKNLESVILNDNLKTIGDVAFPGNNLTSIEIPNKVISIGITSFSNNKLEEVKLGTGLESIGYAAFTGNKLTSIEIPDSVTSLGFDAFASNPITKLVIGKGITTIPANAFSILTELEILILPKTLIEIGESAFAGNKLTEVIIPDSVKSIGGAAFANNKLTSIEIPDSVTSFKWNAFAGNKLTKLVIGKGITTIPDNAFSSITSEKVLEVVVFPETLTEIGKSAFVNQKLAEVIIPDSVKKIGDTAFASNQLEDVKIGFSVEEIGGSAFASNKLTSVTIPSSVMIMGSSVFGGNPDSITITVKGKSEKPSTWPEYWAGINPDNVVWDNTVE